MRWEYAIDVTHIDGSKQRYGFTTRINAETFRKMMCDFKETLEIRTVSEVINLHPDEPYLCKAQTYKLLNT